MSDDKFHVISETKVGELDENLRAEWKRLLEEHDRLLLQQQSHEEALSAFWDALERKFGHHADEHNTEPRFHVADDGAVYLDFCRCPVCQAQVHQMTVVDTVEEMYRNDLIPSQAIDHLRKRAKMVDSQQKTDKKLLN